MTKDQSSRLRTYRGLIKLCIAFIEVWRKYKPFASAFSELVEIVAEIDRQHIIQKTDKSAPIDKRNLLRDELELRVTRLANILSVYAHSINKKSLLNEVSFSEYELNRMKQERFISVCSIVFNFGSELQGELVEYGITASFVNQSQKKFKEYNEQLGLPLLQTSRSTHATQELVRLFKEANDLLSKRLDKLMSHFRESERNFYANYRTIRKVKHTRSGKRKTNKGDSDTPSADRGTPPTDGKG